MWPDQMQAIISKMDNVNPEFGFIKGSRPFIFQEVIDLGNEPIKATDYTGNGRITEFKYGTKLGSVFRKFEMAKWLNNFGRVDYKKY